MADEFNPGEFVTFTRQGGIPVSIVRYGGTFVRVARYGGKAVTFVQWGGTPITVDNERELPEEIKELLGI
ncbi:MAG TPA: hypothetical protein VF813_08620 [Anaerolineaceae bacterium]